MQGDNARSTGVSGAEGPAWLRLLLDGDITAKTERACHDEDSAFHNAQFHGPPAAFRWALQLGQMGGSWRLGAYMCRAMGADPLG